MATRQPTYVVIGHVTFDLTPAGRRPGGTALFAALAAQKLGETVGVVTSAAPDFDFGAALPGVAVANKPSPVTTCFENVVADGRRRQRLHALAAGLDAADVPPAWRQAPIVHLAPLAGEVSPSLLALFPRALRGATAQGWLRRRRPDGWLDGAPSPEVEAALALATATIVSAEDLGDDAALITAYAARAPLLVVTRGAQGCTVYYRGEARPVVAFPTVAADTTGAGDVFAAAFLVALARGADPFAAARFANGAASFAVERPGVEGLPTVAAIEQRLARG